MCVLLVPALVAQQTFFLPQEKVVSTLAPPQKNGSSRRTVVVSKGTEIVVVPLDAISSATAAVGSTVKFAIARDVVAQGFVVIPAGTLLAGTIIDVKRGRAGRHNGRLEMRLQDLKAGDSTLRLKAKRLKPAASFHSIAKQSGEIVLMVAILAVFPFLIPNVIALSRDEEATGADAVIKPGEAVKLFLRSDRRIRLLQARTPSRSSEKPVCDPLGAQLQRVDYGWPGVQINQ